MIIYCAVVIWYRWIYGYGGVVVEEAGNHKLTNGKAEDRDIVGLAICHVIIDQFNRNRNSAERSQTNDRSEI